MVFTPPIPLARDHDSTDFDCGDTSLNQWLERYAWQNMKKGMCRVFTSINTETNAVCGYYATAAGQVNPGTVEDSFFSGLPKHPCPAVVLARLAVDTRCKGQGLGKGLLFDAFKRSLAAAELIGARIIVVHALDAEARDFYKKYGFMNLPEKSGDGFTFFIKISTIAALSK